MTGFLDGSTTEKITGQRRRYRSKDSINSGDTFACSVLHLLRAYDDN
jgi:hypothetical protein